MTHYHGNIDDFGMSSVSLTGPLEAKLEAVLDAGFTQIMLAAGDLVQQNGGLDAAVAQVRASGLTVTGCQTLHDFEGWCGPSHDYKVEIAKSMLEMCHALDCRLLLARSSTSAATSADSHALIRDLRRLAMLAIPMNISITYQADPCGHCVKDFAQAWDLVCQVDMPNLGLGLDALEALKLHNWQDELDLIDPEKLFLVQVCDALGAPDQDFRVFPGEGVNAKALAALVRHLHQLGYRGAYNFDVFNVDDQQLPMSSVARRARRAAVWLGEDVLQRSVPLPNQIRLKRSLAH
jgi:sugar phosphate isomerase/epimerase